MTVTLTDPQPPPANDSCSGQVTQLAFTNDAAKAPGDSTWAVNDSQGTCGGAGPDVVFSFTLSADRAATVQVVGDPSTPSYQPTFYLRRSCADASAGAEYGCTASTGTTAQRSYPRLAAGTYYVWVDSDTAEGGKFAVFVTLGTPAAAPFNDFCALAAPLDFSAGNTATVSGSTTNASDDAQGSCASYYSSSPDLVYSFTTTTARKVTATLTATTGWNPAIYLRSSCADAATDVACNDGSTSLTSVGLQVGSLPAGTYFLWVDGSSQTWSGYDNGDFTLSVTLDAPDPSAAGDTCLSPQPLSFTGGVASVTGKTTYASDSGHGSCQGSDVSADVVYSFTLGSSQSVSVSLVPNTVSYRPAFYLRKACGSKLQTDELVCALAASPGTSANTALANLPAGTYFLWVDGMANTAGDYTLTVTQGPIVPPPANDTCSAPVVLKPATSVQGSTVGARDDYGVGPFSAICAGTGSTVLPGPDVVYVYTPAASGSFTVTLTPESTFDAVLWYTAGTCGGTGLDCADLSDAKGAGGVETLTVNGVAGTAYYFIVDSITPATSGRFGIGVQ
jgi:hypothetical protein